ncbi:hypothetical protein [Arthrobacter sp. Leaf141]|uniref:hypothetical protein n=1 Tax=Arthrobacter sp. Leaf141 TaxID=1736273 RepID=UPI0012FA08C8|nr:hypothetical protein [Arthrobacter sp. Leaf141]
MKRATSLLDQHDVDAVEFSSQEADWKEVRHRHVCCPVTERAHQEAAGSPLRTS